MDGIDIGDWVLSSKHAVTYKEGFHNEVKSSKMIYKSFGSTGLQVSLLGLGGSELALCYGISEEQEGINTVLEAVKSGINYIDTAPFYGHGKSEKVLGKALKNIPRDTYYLATKVGRYGPELQNMFDFSPTRVFKSINESLDRLGIEYADVLLAHDVEFAKNSDVIAYETLPTLQKIKESGKAKYIGITGYPLSILKEIVDKSDIKIDVILSYCRCTLFDNTLRNYISYFKEKGIAIVNAAVLGMGLLTNDGPPDWHPAGSELKTACDQAAKYCKEREVNIAKLAACYSFSQPAIDVHLIGMQNRKLLEMNLHSIIDGLTSYEKTVQDEVSKKFFENLSTSHWENKEVQSYWEKMKEINI